MNQPQPSLKAAIQGRLTTFLFLLVLGLATVFFHVQLGSIRPVHADEAENAYIVSLALAGQGFRFDPAHHHGPTLPRLLYVTSRVTGMGAWQDLEMKTLRMSLSLVSILAFACFVTFRPALGSAGVVASVLLLLSSSLFHYYALYVIHEPLMALFSMGFLSSIYLFLRKPSPSWIIVAGCFLGLLLATKLTALIYVLSWGCGLLVVLLRYQWKLAWELLIHFWRWALVLGAVAMAVSALLYSSGFQQPSAIFDALRSPFVYTVQADHAKPWHFFLTEFVFLFGSAPFRTHDSLLLGCGALAFIWSWTRGRKTGARHLWARFMGTSACVQIALYSLISYKTPWLMFVTWFHIALVGGFFISACWDKARLVPRLVLVCLGILLMNFQMDTVWLLNSRFHSDPRNPLAYVPTSTNIENLPRFMQHFPAETELLLYGDAFWPLPWYLRHHPLTLQSGGALDLENDRILILNDVSYTEVDQQLLAGWKVFPYTLRPNVPVYVFVPPELAEISGF